MSEWDDRDYDDDTDQIMEEFEVYQVIRDTGAAWLLDLGDSDPVWLPQSQCELDLHKEVGVLQVRSNRVIGIVHVPGWLATERGMV
jgi:hypothetical protein